MNFILLILNFVRNQRAKSTIQQYYLAGKPSRAQHLRQVLIEFILAGIIYWPPRSPDFGQRTRECGFASEYTLSISWAADMIRQVCNLFFFKDISNPLGISKFFSGHIKNV